MNTSASSSSDMMAEASVAKAPRPITVLSPYMLYCEKCGCIEQYEKTIVGRLDCTEKFYCSSCQRDHTKKTSTAILRYKSCPEEEEEKVREEERKKSRELEKAIKQKVGRAFLISKGELMDVLLGKMIVDHNTKKQEQQAKFRSNTIDSACQDLQREKTYRERNLEEEVSQKAF